MVCKEDVLSWFKDLESYKRIDLMYELLNMCLPFELRFLGSCIEEIGKHSYEELRGQTINANEMDKLIKDQTLNQGLLEESVRHRVLIYLSLLSSRNYSVANWLYKNLLRTDWIEDYIVKGNLVKDENLHSEFLLLFVMALHHPAFTFEQKLFFGKLLTHLIDIKDSRITTSTTTTSSPKLNMCPGHPPGFGYPPIKQMTVPEVPPVVPVKTAITIPCMNETLHQQPPGLPHVPPPPPPPSTQEFIPWNRSGFACGATEVPPPFPPPAANVSPLVSQSTSPIHSRSNSPHRNMMAQPPPPLRPNTSLPPPPPSVLETIPIAGPIPVDPLTNTNNFSFIFPPDSMKIAEDEMGSIPEERLIIDNTWPGMNVAPKEIKQLNGLRFPSSIANSNSGVVPITKAPPRPFMIEQLQSLTINDNCVNSDNCTLQRSNSSSSSSLNRTPPDTPAPTTLTTSGTSTHPHCRVVGGGGVVPSDKPRVNGLPPLNFGGNTVGGGGGGTGNSNNGGNGAAPPPPGLPIGGDTTSSPPLQPTFNSVPYTTYPTPFTAIPSRSMFPYTNQNYRPPFTTHFPTYQTNENSFPTYTLHPYMSIIYSSPQYPARNPNCYNCGAMGHFGQDCTGQNIQDITQSKSYLLEYATQHLPDNDK